MLVVVLNMPEHSSFQNMLFPMLFISKYAKSYASIMDISLSADHEQDWQPYPVDPYSAICDDHTYIHTYIHTMRRP